MCSIALSVRMRRFAIAVARSLRAWRCGRGGGRQKTRDRDAMGNTHCSARRKRIGEARASARGRGASDSARDRAPRRAAAMERKPRAPLPRPRAPSARDPSRCCASLGSNRSRRSARAIPRRSPRDLSGARPRTRSTRGRGRPRPCPSSTSSRCCPSA
eukprot:30911-Pelagococcus_subviridis.AAC.3